MRFDGELIEDPYKCDPRDQSKKCELFFDIDEEDKAYTEAEGMKRNIVQNQCKCALDGNLDSGYCSSLIGSLLYERAMSAKYYIMASSECHTLDRYNW